MSCQSPVAPLLAFYANGTLSPEDRTTVETHLAGCDDCRALLGLARLARQPMAAGFDPADHVQAQLLAEYVADPGSLEQEARAWVAAHLKDCEVCASVVPVLSGMPDPTRDERSEAGSPAAVPARARGPAWLWGLLKATILHPIPAMTYLALVIGLLWLSQSGSDLRDGAPAALLPPAVGVHGEIAMRGEEVASPPLRLEAPSGAPLHLALYTDLDPEVTGPGAPPLRLVLRHGGDVLWSMTVDHATIPADGVLEMMLRPDQLPRGVALVLSLERESGPESPLFRKRVLVAEP